GIGTIGPDRILDVLHASDPQMRLTQADGTEYSDFKVDSAGDLRLTASGGDLKMVNDNIWICSGGSMDTLNCPTISSLSDPNNVGNLVVENDIFADGYRRVSCPAGMIEVPPSPQDGMDGFCVDKYEAKNDTGDAVSEAAGTPWTSIAQYDAREECIRAGKHLITEQEWLAIAHNIEDVGWNWNGGTAGTNQMSDGHSDDDGSGALVADITGDADDDPCVNTGQSCDTSTWNTQRRTYKLSNDEYIWDFGGNVWEWVDQATYADYPVANNWLGWTTCSTSGDGICGNTRTTNDQRYGGNTTALRAFIRGGFWAYGASSGAFSLDLYGAPSDTLSNIGFRCAR
ncbi:MAG: SUMF1/EgtB/PvdO family nonheme iron enzyme, partial [Thermodesulfobacteriota bacterium]|nr:SUMF1/EgtB/PvdO family nonheme iron enzyme [Thermodesulfobacteriota bacterium]